LSVVAASSAVAASAKEDAAQEGKSGKARFSAQLIFLPSFRRAANRAAQARRADLSRQSRFGDGGSRLGERGSKPVKVDQTSSVAQAGGQNRMQISINEQLAKEIALIRSNQYKLS
jgi:hypothetical protein